MNEPNEALRKAVKYLVDHDSDGHGNQTRLAEHFKVSRQRVHQIVVECRRARLGKRPVVKGVGGIREKVTA